jgi:hypothetical protein
LAAKQIADRGKLNWLTPACAVIGALILFTVIAACQPDTSLLLFWFVAAPLLIAISIGLLIYVSARKSRGKRLRVLSTLAIVWALAVAIFIYDLKHPSAIRSAARWRVWSHNYKSQVLAQPNSNDGEFKHIEWDGWGMAGMDTSVFLVYDPEDKLSTAASSGQSGKFDGIPCEVSRVNRLESHWYAVQFYTDQSWDSCE